MKTADKNNSDLEKNEQELEKFTKEQPLKNTFIYINEKGWLVEFEKMTNRDLLKGIVKEYKQKYPKTEITYTNKRILANYK